MMKSARGVLTTLVVSNCSPEMAVPMTVNMPEPITAPMPSAVSDHGPRVFLSACPGSMESEISLSMDLRASSWLNRADLLGLMDREADQLRAFPVNLRASDSSDKMRLSPGESLRPCAGRCWLAFNTRKGKAIWM